MTGSINEIIDDLIEYFDDKADAEYTTDRASGSCNEEMDLLEKVREMKSLLTQKPSENLTQKNCHHFWSTHSHAKGLICVSCGMDKPE